MRNPLPILLALALAACASTGATRCPADGCADIRLYEVADDAADGWSARLDNEGYEIHVRELLAIPGSSIRKVGVMSDPFRGGGTTVEVEPETGERLRRLTAERIGKRVAIEVDGQLIVLPYISGEFGTEFLISNEAPAALRDRLLGR